VGMGARYWRGGDEARGGVTVGPAFEGPPGRVHGGALAAIFDEIMGALLPAIGVMAFTGRLTVRYRKATPLGVPLELRSWLASREGRRLHLEAEAKADGVLFANAEAIFVEQDPSVLLAEHRPTRQRRAEATSDGALALGSREAGPSDVQEP